MSVTKVSHILVGGDVSEMISKPRRQRRPVHRFLNERSGAAMVEFAMTGFMFLMAILWLVEIGLVYMTTLELEGATKDVARIVRTNRLSEVRNLEVPAETKDDDKLAVQFRQRVCARVVFAVGCEKYLRVAVRSAKDFSGFATNALPPDLFAKDVTVPAQAGNRNDFVIVTAVFASPLSVFGTERTLRASALTRNEP